MRPSLPVLTSVIIGAAVGLMALAAGAQQLRLSCDGHDRLVSAQNVPRRAAEPFALARRGADGCSEEQLAAAATGAEGLRQQFIQADDDGDGRISHDEWLRFFGPAHAGLAAEAGRRSSGTD